MGYKMYEPIPSSEVALRFMQYSKDAQETLKIPVLRVHDDLAAYSFCPHVLNLFMALGFESYVRRCCLGYGALRNVEGGGNKTFVFTDLQTSTDD